MIKFSFKPLFLALIFTVALANTTYAQSQESINESFYLYPAQPNAINPRSFIYELKPGTSISDEIMIKNTGTLERTFDIYPTELRDEPNPKKIYKDLALERSVAKWVSLSSYQEVLKPNEIKKIQMDINIPADAPLSENHFAIAMSTKKDQESNSDKVLQVTTRFLKDLSIKVTDTPQEIPKLMEANIFNSTTPYLWSSIGIFVASMAYFIYAKKREKNAQKQESKN